MEQSILYYNNDTQSLYFDEVNQLNISEKPGMSGDNFLTIVIYFLGFYHLSWYIINSSRRFNYDETNKRLCDCRAIFRILNENFDMFDKESVEKMNTSQLLEDTLEFLGEDCSSVEEESHNSGEESEDESHDIEEIEAAKTLTSMGKNWEYKH